jgi:hypothetical protein
MDRGPLLVAPGAAITTTLFVAVAVIELLAVEFSAIVGLPVGVLAGLAVFAAVLAGYGSVGAGARRAVAGLAAFGYAVLVLLALRYANVAGARSLVTVPVLVGAGVATALAVSLGLWVSGRGAA